MPPTTSRATCRRRDRARGQPRVLARPYYHARDHPSDRDARRSASLTCSPGPRRTPARLDWDDFTQAADVGPADGVGATHPPERARRRSPGSSTSRAGRSRTRSCARRSTSASTAASSPTRSPRPTTPRAALAIPAIFGQAQPTVYDPVQARSLMRAAGYSNGVNVTCTPNDAVAGGDVGDAAHLLYNRLIEIDIKHRNGVRREHRPAARARAPPPRPVEHRDRQAAARRPGVPARAGRQRALDPVSPAADEGYHSTALSSTLDQLLDATPGTGATRLRTRRRRRWTPTSPRSTS